MIFDTDSDESVLLQGVIDLLAVKDGKATFRGFYGEYDAEIICNGITKTVTIPISSKRNNEFEVIV